MKEEPTATASTAAAAFPSNVIEWFSRRTALAAARVERLPPWQRTHVERGHRAAAVGDYLIDGRESLDVPPVATAALSMYREAVYWGLRALGPETPAGPVDVRGAFSAAPRAVLARLAGGEDQLDALSGPLVEQSFIENAELDGERAGEAARHARAFARALLDHAAEGDVRFARLRRQRIVRPLAAVVFIATVTLFGPRAWKEAHRPPDLARGKEWTASSAAYGFSASGRTDAKGLDGLLFHTAEESHPWVRIDLGTVTNVAEVLVENRLSCCTERAVPLVVELGVDGRAWREVARRNEVFTEWRATFSRQPARFVRLSVLRPTVLHLGRVSVY